jgi:hypothetical protein
MWRLPLYAHFNDKLEKNLAFSCAIAFRPAQCGNYTKPRCFRSRVGREGAYEQFLHMYLNDQTPNYFRGNKIGKLKTSASYSKRDVFNCRATQILIQPAYLCNARALMCDLRVDVWAACFPRVHAAYERLPIFQNRRSRLFPFHAVQWPFVPELPMGAWYTDR